MIFSRQIIFVIFNLLATSVDSFVVKIPSSWVSLPSTSFQFKTSTCLRAEEDNETETQEDAAGDASDAGGDILNSPAFLKRKIDVLKSDIVQADADIEATQAQAEEGKAEWGSQFEDLQREVSCLVCI
jgi:hypothetical protein